MNHPSSLSHPSDMCLLLRAYAEQRWITSELLPVVRELESPEQIPKSSSERRSPIWSCCGWTPAGGRPETDAALEALGAGAGYSPVLSERARRYHAAVRRLRASVEERVRRITHLGSPPSPRERAGL